MCVGERRLRKVSPLCLWCRIPGFHWLLMGLTNWMKKKFTQIINVILLKNLKISDLRFHLITQSPKWNNLELTLPANFIGTILIMRRKLPFVVQIADTWPIFFCLPPSSLLERSQTRRGACLSLKRLFVSMVMCLLHLQSCNLGNSIKGSSRQLLLKWF